LRLVHGNASATASGLQARLGYIAIANGLTAGMAVTLSMLRRQAASGDELVIAEWDRATRSMWDGLQILKEIIDAEATIRVLDRAYIDLTSPIGRGFMAFISAMAEDERLRIIKRTHEGRAIARENGVKMGRKFRLNDVQRAEARQRLGNGEAASHLARVYGVSRATIYRV
jgi:DNA invertase Pin-like site-specific DNA recombinase